MEFEFAELVEMDPAVRRWLCSLILAIVDHIPNLLFVDVKPALSCAINKRINRRLDFILRQIVCERNLESGVNYPTLLAHGSTVRFVEGGAFAWTPVLAAGGGRLVIAVHVQCPAIQAHVYGCASARRLLRRAEILQTDILRRVVVRVW